MSNLSTKIVPIILCGGQGSRLWPLSRKGYPKQFLEFTHGGSLLQETIKRIKDLSDVTDPIIICNEEHYFLTYEQMHTINVKPARIILEPVGKNTAPAIAIGAIAAELLFENNPLLLIMPADHFIQDPAQFRKAIDLARNFIDQKYLLTFGIKPTSPKTGYGYIKVGNSIGNDIRQVDHFTEKPDLTTAEQYCASENYLWNSGMFMFRAETYMQEIKQHAPMIYKTCVNAFSQAINDDNYLRLTLSHFQECPEDSIDYAIMEKTPHAAVLPIDCGWADMGDWTTIAETQLTNADGNALKGDVLTEDVSNCCIYSHNRLIAAIGIHNQVVIETKDAVLIADKSRTQDVKRIVTQLQELSHRTTETHHRVFRSWGYYEDIINTTNYAVKYIVVKPFAKLPSQKHQHHTEHWIVVQGAAVIEFAENHLVLHSGESTYIARDTIYQLINTSNTLLYMMEIQTGDHLNEQDIIHVDDIHDNRQLLTTN